MNREDKTFSEQLRMWRKSKGLKRDEAGTILGVAAETIGKWERGAVPKDKYKSHLSEVLGISVSDLFLKDTNTFAARLKAERLKRGLTTKEVSDKIGYTRASISNWERGMPISEYAKEDICAFYGLEVVEVWKEPLKRNLRN